jgi:GNAT superfamily N-acetyltransferase
VPGSVLTMRRAWPADADTIARTSLLGQETWRAFAPDSWTPRAMEEGAALVRELLSQPSAWALMAFVDGEPAGHCTMVAGDWDEPRSAVLWALFVRPRWFGTGLADRLHEAFVAEATARDYPWAWLSTPAAHARARRFYERRGWRADTLLETGRGLAWAIYGRSLLPPAAASRENPVADAGVGSRP